MLSEQRKEARKLREWLDQKEADGLCTLCIRALYPHEWTEDCKRTKESEPEEVGREERIN